MHNLKQSEAQGAGIGARIDLLFDLINKAVNGLHHQRALA